MSFDAETGLLTISGTADVTVQGVGKALFSTGNCERVWVHRKFLKSPCLLVPVEIGVSGLWASESILALKGLSAWGRRTM